MANVTDNRTDMIRATTDYDSTTKSVTATSGITAYAGVLAMAVNKLKLIDGLTAIANATTKGVTLDTVGLKQAMCFLAGKCGQAVAAYASSAHNNALKAAVDFTEAKLMKLKKDVVDDTCEDIRAAADANIGVAGAFGYVASDVTDLGTAIGLYRIGMSSPRQAIISKSQAKAQIKALQDDIIQNLFVNQLDKMAYTLRGTTNAWFYDGHHQAREIIDRGHETGKINGHAHNVLGTNMAGVVFSVFKAGTDVLVKSVTTKANGLFSVTKLFGDYDCTWECPGFKKLSEKGIKVGAGKRLTRTVVMIPDDGKPVIN